MKQTAKLAKRLAAIPKKVVAAVEPALIKSGEELVAQMRALAPEDTGALKRSITATPPGQSTPPYSQPGGSKMAAANQVLVTAGNTDVRYPHLVEYGTAHAPAQPYFWPAYRLSKKKITGRLKRAVRKAVRDAK
jgi:HK97 gp10 family phage protein